MTSHAYGNPHTDAGGGGPAGSTVLIERARSETLAMCNVSLADYDCVFTSGATGALKLVAEAFPWSPGSVFAYTLDNHNSVVGMREEALAAGATAQAVVPSCTEDGTWRLQPSGDRMQRQPSDPLSQRSYSGGGGGGGGGGRCSDSSGKSGVSASDAKSGADAKSSDSSSSGPQANNALAASGSLPDGLVDGAADGAASDAASEAAAAAEPLFHLFAYPAESNFCGARYSPVLGTAVRARADCAAALEEAVSATEASESGSLPDPRQPAGTGSEASETAGAVSDAAEAAGAAGPPSGETPHRWLVALDAAKACASWPPDLRADPVDFVALSYYKIFGYPTGLGALLIRRDAVPVLRKRFFGGGTVDVSVSNADFFRRREGAAGLEDGTAHFLGIAALRHGFAAIRRAGGFGAIDAHTNALARHASQQLTSLRHFNDRPVAEVYTPEGVAAAAAQQAADAAYHVAMAPPRPPSSGSDGSRDSKVSSLSSGGSAVGSTAPAASGVADVVSEAAACGGGGGSGDSSGSGGSRFGITGQGPVVTFNLRRSDGSWVGYREVERLAGLRRIRLRTGAFCNPGATAAALGLSAEDVRSHYEDGGHVCWDDRDLIDGRPTGAVRFSFGYMSNLADAEAVLALVRDFFVEAGPLTSRPAAAAAHPAAASQAAVAAHATAPLTGATAGSRPAKSASGDASEAEAAGPPPDAGVPAASEPSTPLPPTPLLPSTPPRPPPPRPATPPATTPRQRCGHQSGDPSAGLAVSAAAAAAAAATSALRIAAPSPPAASAAPAVCAAGGTSTAAVGVSGWAASQQSSQPAPRRFPAGGGRLSGLWVYPIKSCAAVQAESWPLGANGLLLDREWAVVGPAGGALRRTLHPRLAAIQPRIDFDEGFMEVRSPHVASPMRISLEAPPAAAQQAGISVRVCGDLVPGCAAVPATPTTQPAAGDGAAAPAASAVEAGAVAVSAWFSAAVGTRCSLVRQQEGARTAFHTRRRHSQDSAPEDQADAQPETIGFANEGQLLLLNAASLAELRQRLPPDPATQQDPAVLAEGGSKGSGGTNTSSGRSGASTSESAAGSQLFTGTTGGDSVAGTVNSSDSLQRTAAAGTATGASHPAAVAAGHPSALAHPADTARFRPNLLVEGPPPFAEDGWSSVQIGPHTFSVTGPCARCEMVCGDPATGECSGPEPLLTLASFRRDRAAINFGVLLGSGGQHEADSSSAGGGQQDAANGAGGGAFDSSHAGTVLGGGSDTGSGSGNRVGSCRSRDAEAAPASSNGNGSAAGDWPLGATVDSGSAGGSGDCDVTPTRGAVLHVGMPVQAL